MKAVSFFRSRARSIFRYWFPEASPVSKPYSFWTRGVIFIFTSVRKREAIAASCMVKLERSTVRYQIQAHPFIEITGRVESSPRLVARNRPYSFRPVGLLLWSREQFLAAEETSIGSLR